MRSDHEALPPEEDMDRILRYEEKMQRQIDWAVQRLLESQERRRILPATQNRSQ
jgi:cobalamin biosynthesis protein CobT